MRLLLNYHIKSADAYPQHAPLFPLMQLWEMALLEASSKSLRPKVLRHPAYVNW